MLFTLADYMYPSSAHTHTHTGTYAHVNTSVCDQGTSLSLQRGGEMSINAQIENMAAHLITSTVSRADGATRLRIHVQISGTSAEYSVRRYRSMRAGEAGAGR